MAAYDLLEAIEGTFPNTVRERQKAIPLKDAYRAISWVYACCNLIADCIAGVEFELFRYSRKGEEIDLKITDPAYKAFNPPAPGQITTLSEMIKLQFLHLGLFGESFGLPTTKGDRMIGLEIISPLLVSPDLDQNGKLKAWEVRPIRGTAAPRKIKPEDMVQWKYANPYDNYRGMAPLHAARMAIEQDLNMSTWNAGFFQNGIRNPIALLLKQTFNDNQRKEFMSRLKANFAGFSKGQLPLLVEGGVDVKVLANTMKDLDFVEGKSLTREELCAVYGCPPAQVGIFRYANYANSKEQRNIFYLNTLRPKMIYYRGVFQTILDKYFPGVECEWEWDEVDAFKEDPLPDATAAKMQAETAVALFNAGYDQKQIAVILDNEDYDPANNPESEDAYWKPDLEPQLPEPEEDSPEDEAEDAAEGGSEKSISMAKARDHFTIYAKDGALLLKAKRLAALRDETVRKFALFVKTFGEQHGKVKGMSDDYWQSLWEEKIFALFEQAYLRGFISVFNDLKMETPEHTPYPEDYAERLQRLYEVPKQLAKMKGKLSIESKIRADRIVPAIFALGREQGMRLVKTQMHKWCWAGDSEHQHLHGTEAVFGKAFASTKITYPGAVQGEKVCTCTSFPSRLAREEKRVAITKP